MLSSTLLTTDSSVVLLIDYQDHVLKGVRSHDQELLSLKARALAKVSRSFDVPVVLSTVGVGLRGDAPTLESIRSEIPSTPEIDRDTMNAWDDTAFRNAVAKTGRRRLIFAGLWTEVCLQYPVLHAQREGFETYFVEDAVGGNTLLAHNNARARMIQAGSQPLTLAALVTEWIRDWKGSPHVDAFFEYSSWYEAEAERIRQRLRNKPFRAEEI